jgi:hypothetical protein
MDRLKKIVGVSLLSVLLGLCTRTFAATADVAQDPVGGEEPSEGGGPAVDAQGNGEIIADPGGIGSATGAHAVAGYMVGNTHQVVDDSGRIAVVNAQGEVLSTSASDLYTGFDNSIAGGTSTLGE